MHAYLAFHWLFGGADMTEYVILPQGHPTERLTFEPDLIFRACSDISLQNHQHHPFM